MDFVHKIGSARQTSAAGISLTLVPLLIIVITIFQQNSHITHSADLQSQNLEINKLDTIVTCSADMCQTQQEIPEINMQTALKVARDILERQGRIQLVQPMVAWNAKNQFTQSEVKKLIPAFHVGGQWLGQISDMSQPAPVVDKVKKMTNATDTIFQRMDEAGNMLRVCTNVKGQNGARAIGTYIPAVNPDGVPNPVVQAVLQGRTFVGRAFVVDSWYIAAYDPLRDSDGRIIGMLYVGVMQDNQDSLSKKLRKIRVGQNGRLLVLNATGKDRGRYIIGWREQDDGKSGWDEQDSEGVNYLQDICHIAMRLNPGEIGEKSYTQSTSNRGEKRKIITRFTYFKPWDWILVAAAYDGELNQGVKNILTFVSGSRKVLISISLLSLLAAVLVWWFIANSLTGKIIQVVRNLSESAEQTANAAAQISFASQSLAAGANKQASAAQEANSGLERMASMTKQNAVSSEETRKFSGEVGVVAGHGLEAVEKMAAAVLEIKQASDKTEKIIKSIEEIAFQTNLLALNAAVEAARAGESGKGFAVVAEEVRNLARRSSEAAKNTVGLIQEASHRADLGVEIANSVTAAFQKIGAGINKMNELIVKIAGANEKQAQASEQIGLSMKQVDTATQANAATSEEAASTAEELNAQVKILRDNIESLTDVVDKGAGHR